MYGAGEAWADLAAGDITIQVEPNASYGTVTATSVSGREVTLTVTPVSGYYIKASDIVVEPLAGMGRANARRRAPGLAEQIVGTLYNHATNREPENVIYSVTGTSTAYYVFTLPERYDGAYVTATFTETVAGEIRIPNSSSITYNASGHYILEDDVEATVLADLYTGSQTTDFAGIFEGVAKPDGTFPKITGATHALFDKINGGTVKNIIVVPASTGIIGSNHVGAIVNEVIGTNTNIASIYNCGVLSGSISGSGHVGGLVGHLGQGSPASTVDEKANCYARVINCFSYADIGGGSVRAGIVGYNSYSSTYIDQRTMVMNCMFYGDIDDTDTNLYPIYGGKDINNYTDGGKLNTYNYYLYEAPYSKNKKITATSNTNQHYNHALAAEEIYLTRFEFYRNLLNSTRELAAWYATGSTANAHSTMAKWVLDKSIAKYPILKVQDSNTTGTYPSIINYDPERTYDAESGTMVSRTPYSEDNRNKGGTIGTLDVRISGVGINAPTGARLVKSTLRLVRTDKDYDDYNFNYDKVQLPYYNEVGIGNCTHNKVVTGWKITGITAVSGDPYTASHYTGTNYDSPYYNFADRASSNKDLFSVSGRVFSQGAYFDVPNGVTSITIEPYWGNAAYLSDEYYDCNVKDGTFVSNNQSITIYNCESVNITGSERYTNDTEYSINGDNQKVYTSITDAVTSLGSGTGNVYDNAVVLVGNYHLCASPSSQNSAGPSYTIMSADLNNDNEPDYSLIFRSSKQEIIDPIRFDFINVPGMAMAHKVYENDDMAVPGNLKSRGWFEVTNTCLIHFSQFEYDSEKKEKNEPLILLGGIIDQIVSTNGTDSRANDNTKFIHLGSNVYFPIMFSNGCHMDKVKTVTPHRPISVTGGDYKEFYLTGNLQPNTKATSDNAECYISGGRFGDVAGAGQEQLNGNVNWFIDHADIENFYGGGINDKNPITGNITTVIKNSHVNKVFCGGPKFGDMSKAGNMKVCGDNGTKNVNVTIDKNRTVSTTATDCVFGTYFGAGYGGTSLFRENVYNNYLNYLEDHQWKTQTDKYDSNRGKYYTGKGILTGYDYRLFEGTRPKTVGLLFLQYASLSLATTNNVTSTLKGCTMDNFYGGGSLGKVDGDIESNLEDCTIHGSVYGAGFSAQAPTADVFPTGGFNPVPKYSKYTGVFDEGVYPTAVKYTWSNDVNPTDGTVAIDDSEYLIYVDRTDKDLSALGTVTGKVTVNITGKTLVEGHIYDEDGHKTAVQEGGVFGGGDASAALGDTEVNIEATGRKEGYTYNTYNVFGGGNKADVSGSVVVNMKNGVVDNDVYGGGALANTNTANWDASANSGAGGWATGMYNETTGKTTKITTVNLQGGTINGDAYGGGLGRREATGVTAVEATVYGDITVNLGDADANVAATKFNISNYIQEGYTSVVKSGRVFGANNLNGSPKGNVTVNVYKTVAGNHTRTAAAAYKKKEGETGYAAPTYEVAAVYGGGNLADYTTTGKKATVNIETCNVSIESVYGGGNAAAVPATEVNVHGAYEIQYVFGGGNGKDPYTLDGGTNWTLNHGADVIGNASTMLTGGFIHEAYGASNEKGTIGGTASLQADDAGDTDCALDVWKMVGAGKNADYFGDVNLVLGCMPEAKVDAIFGGADNANVFGNVTLTVTSGNFGAVYGGNNLSGIINGQIILNVEETGCRPINIDALYLGGNEAAYSKYGYYVKTTTGDGSPGETAVLTDGKLTLLPRQSATDTHKPVKMVTGTTWTVYAGGTTEPYPEYADPILNVRSFTSIGEVFGGGYGNGATMYANPTVNINQTYGIKSDGNGGYTAKATELGTIGDVYGGGDAAAVEGITTVNIGTETTVDFVTEPKLLGTKGTSLETDGIAYVENENGTFKTNVVGTKITEDVFGGGKLANVRDITNVNICVKENTTTHVYESVTPGAAGVTISRNVFGGGRGEAVDNGDRAFYCEEAMVGVNDLNSAVNNVSSTYANYGTHVRIGNGTVNGSVYGGGEMGRVEFHTEVTIGYGEGTGSTTKSPVVNGYVYGAGKGAVTHGYSGLVRGNSTVTIQGDAKVGESVYGGGEKASVGKYEVVDGLPKTPLWGGKCTVAIKGYAEIGPDNMQMVTPSGKPNDTGHVFGGGAGILPYENVTGTPYSIQPGEQPGDPSRKVEYPDGSETAYFTFIRSLGLASNTDVNIGGHAFVKGSVYGGSENGYIQSNTHVKIAGGQVGAGFDETQGKSLGRYADNQFINPTTTAVTDENALKECAHWPFASPYASYDIYKDSNNDGKPDAAGDGHTFYGNVFGGGRGYYPYAEGPELTDRQKGLGYSKGLWLDVAGSVGGNTVVDITNGHILTSVYGGNEMTNVTGSCTINMVGGTVGVPRTVAQMQAHPVTCYVFGAGKGDQRVNFTSQTNVASTQVNVSGTARIYGSTFGGGEDGHVYGDVETNIGGTVNIDLNGDGDTTDEGETFTAQNSLMIGTTGTSSVDGNIFGGGRGFSETALTAGVVCGDVRVNIYDGTILGSVFGGGRLASIGTYLAPAEDDTKYGIMQVDDNTSTHGHTSITIEGGTIGATDSDGKLVNSNYSIGDVFGGCKGSFNSSDASHLRYGEVKTTSIIMSGGKVNGSVYGGGEIAQVLGNTSVAINGGEVGDGVTKKGGAKIGNVYGAGKGSLDDPDDGLIKGNTLITINETDKTNHPTKINHNIYGGGAYASVGDIHRSNEGAAYVPGRDTNILKMPTSWTRKVGDSGTDTGTAEINILGGQLGTDGDENGMVFGSSRGDVTTPEGATSSSPLGTDVDPNDRTAWVYDTKVVIGTLGSATGPEIRGSVYGSGENGHVYNNTDVQIHSGKIGVDASTTTYGSQSITDPITNIEYTIAADYPKRGNIYGGGCGEDDYKISDVRYFNPLAGIVLGNVKVTVDGGKVVHNIYGGGALGSVGSPGLDTGGKATIDISGGVVGDNGINDGNVFGASRGNLDVVQANIAQVKETQVDIKPNKDNSKPDPIIWNDVYGGGEAGIVIGNVTVNISGGRVYNDVYGGGALANTNTGNWDDQSNLAENAKTKTYYAVSSIAAGDNLTDKGYYKRPYNQATGTAQSGTTYYEKKGFYNPVDEDEITVGTTLGTGYFTEDYVLATEVTAVAGTTYFLKYYYPADVATGADVTGYYTKTAQDTYVSASGTAEEGTIYYRQTYNPVSGISAGDDITGKGYFKVEYKAATGTAQANVTYYRYEEIYSPVKGISEGDPVNSYYTAGDYTIATGPAEANMLYYKVVTGDWVSGKNDESTGTTYKTKVNLTGGLIGHSLQGSYPSYTTFDYKGGDVYGGGLGRLANGAITAVEAMVYGDIEIKVDGTAFIQRLLSPSSTENQVPLSGRVFGCNNLNGTPKGNVTVNVNKTIPVVNGVIGTNHDENRFEIHSVYGGGNMASYMPANGKKSKVNIYGCDETYIEKVFGGGNSASVPATDVEIFGTGYVGYAFGGGNGADKIWRNGSWNKNGGAPIYGDASIIAHGGKIGQVFSGSDTKGTVYGSATVKLAGQDEGVAASSCPLKITNTYGAGRGADINGDVNLIVSGCATENAIERVFGGSYDANIRGDVNLTITSGIFTQVFGGNDHGGSIGGNINVNIEESDNCNEPTIIQYLYGGGREAIYPGPRARNTSGSSVARGKITVNVKSATRIDNVYGGSYRAQVNGDTEVNINMIKGNMVTKGIELPETYRGDVIPNVDGTVTYTPVTVTVGTTPVTGYYTCDDETATDKTYTKVKDQDAVAESGVTYYKMSMSGTIKDEIGTIGNVFGGSFESYVNGNATVNIGTATSVDILKRATADTTDPDTHESIPVGTILDTNGKSIYGADGKMREGITIAYEPKDVLGAHITGNVYGGGDNAELIGNTYVHICTEKVEVLDANNQPTGEYTYVPMINTTVTSGVEIQGTEWQYGVFGGGNRGIVGGDSYVYLGGGSVLQSIYGGGCEADVSGNTNVMMLGGYVFDGVYGGGLAGSVGTVTSRTTVTGHGVNVKHGQNDCLIGKPDGFKENTGKCTVVISGGQIGPVEVALADGGMKNTKRYYKDPNDENDIGPVDYGFVFGAGRGDVMSPIDDPDADFYTYVRETEVTISGGLIMASVYGGGENGRVRGNTLVKIQGGQIGCGEGKVENGKPVPYTDTQWTNETPSDFKECASWDYGKDTNNDGKEDIFLPYDPLAGLKYSNGTAVTDGSTTAYDGHTYYGCVFGGGSGYYPYEYTEDGVKKHDWLRSAGMVEGSTKVLITGGHILTSVYGGNETTDVTGDSCVVIMTGGTLGVPRTDADAKKHPVTCYLFGAGKGDQRTHFNTWTNVQNTRVHVGGTARIFGSVFGGGEDGHILKDGRVDIFNGKIGTKGTSYVDGNVFGGGRGFSGESLTAGSVGGNVTTNIYGGTILGSVYGGGRLASVGIGFVNPTLTNGDPNPYYGLLTDDVTADVHYTQEEIDAAQEGDDAYGKTINNIKTPAGSYGHVTVNISGGIIGNDVENAQYGGNVFGGSMGRNTLLNDEMNELWPKLAVVKLTEVNIKPNTDPTKSPVIKKNVYGGGELGIVRNRATVNVSGGEIHGNVFGGGYGSKDNGHPTTITAGGYESIPTVHYTFTPMIWNGCVSGNTYVNVSGGKIYNTVYGGGEMASVGLINFNVTEKTDGEFEYKNKKYSYSSITKHADPATGFALSWPYEVEYIQAAPHDATEVGGQMVGGKATVEITGGRIGIGEKADGDVYGGSKGAVGDRYTYAFCGNVRETEVKIGYSTTPGTTDLYHVYYDSVEKEWQDGLVNKNSTTPNLIMGSVYGGGENGHVMEDAKVNITGGLIGHAVYGGGKGKDKYSQTLTRFSTTGTGASYTGDSYSITAGKVYGNTSVSMSGGHVIRNIYGGGNLASVGKGNYAGGTDDYSYNGTTSGYGESITGALWTNTDFMNSGKTAVTITGGKVGFENSQKDDLPVGNVFGGSRGKAAAEVTGLNVNPEFYVGYVNETDVKIGDGSSGPTILGSVYGGGQDGHVRRETHVTINKGDIGVDFTSANITAMKTAYSTLDDTEKAKMEKPDYFLWLHRGNVYGGGSGIGKYKFNYSGNTDSEGKDIYENGQITIGDNKYYEKGYSSSAGSVTHSTKVEIKGGTIYRNVYGGGSLASVCPPTISPTKPLMSDDTEGKGKKSVNLINISGGTIGNADEYAAGYGGNVFGASRGMTGGNITTDFFALTTGSLVNILPNNADRTKDSHIYGDVYGGGEMGKVVQNTNVQLTGGIIDHDVYGGGKGLKATSETAGVAADIGGNTIVELNKGVGTTSKGCVVESIFGCNNLNGTPKGHVKVHVYATQNKDAAMGTIKDKYAKIPSQGENDTEETLLQYLQRMIDATKKSGGGYLDDRIDENVIDAAQAAHDKTNPVATDGELNAQIDAVKAELDKVYDVRYDVKAVYGGGNLAMYYPTDADDQTEAVKNAARTEVIIDGCDYSSIYQVYGGGNAAPTSGTYVRVNGSYEIGEVFGGGNGKDNYPLDGLWYENPGANVGYKTYSHYDSSTGTGAEATPYEAIDNSDASSKELRQANYSYGSGIATTEIAGGRIHVVYGGSNKKGNIATTALSVYEGIDDSCPLKVDETYGAGKDAPQDGTVNLTMDCVRDMREIFGGAKNADVNADIVLRITNGSHFERVFGGNNTSGAISGSITVDVKEEGCEPIMIEELYGGGYLAPYSIYGYKQNQDGSYQTEPKTYEGVGTIQQRIPYTKETFATYKTQLEGYMKNDLTTLGLGGNPTDEDIENAIEAAIAAGEGSTDETVIAKYNAALDYVACQDILSSYPKKDPNINIISATKIDNVYGGGYKALVVGTPHINVNMTTGKMEVVKDGDVYRDVNKTTVDANYKVNGVTIPSATPTQETETVGEEQKTKYYIGLPLGVIGNIFGGGNMADIYGNTHVEIGTGKHHNMATGEVETITPARNDAVITGNVYGGGRMGHVGNFSLVDADYNTANSTSLPIGKPISCVEGTGTCNVTISNGSIGPNDMAMFHLDASGNIPTGDKPDNSGHVFGGGMGTNKPADFDKAFVNKTEVTIDGTAFVKGSVFGGGENGHVLNDTHVIIDGDCQIGNGHIMRTDAEGNILKDAEGKYIYRGINRPYTAAEWAARRLFVENDPAFMVGNPAVFTLSDEETALRTAVGGNYTSSLPECDSWLFGKTISAGKVVASDHAPHDILANKTGDLDKYSDNTTSTEGGRYIASDGRAFNGSVYGGGSGYFPHAAGQWLDTAGQVEGNTKVEVKGGHILTSLYGGCEMTSVLGNTEVIMTGGTLGVPRTLDEIAAHPVTCYIFGGGKGEGRSFLNNNTNVQDASVTVTGGWVYGSVFGGAEDGHVLGDARVTIGGTAVGPTMTDAQAYAAAFAGEATKIGTWGTSYVDGNIFGGGRGFDGINLFAGTIGGNTTINITGGTMLGSIYGGGRMASVGADFSATSDLAHHGHLKEDEGGKTYGYSTINISGGTIGKEFTTNVAGAEHSGNVFGGSMGRLLKLDGVNYLEKWPQLAQVKTATVNISGNPTIYRSVYGGGEFGSVRDHAYVTIGGTLGADKTTVTPVTTGTPIIHHNVFGGGYGTDIRSAEATKVVDIVDNSGETPTTIHYIFTPMIWAGCVGKTTNVNICGGHILRNVYGGGEMASVGVIDYTGVKVTETPSTETDDVFVNVKDGNVVETWKYNNIVKNHDTSTSFALSWPYKITKDSYLEDFPGVATVNITGGRIGITGKDWFGAYETDDNGQYVQVQEKDANGNPILDSNNVPVMRKIRVREDNGDVFGGGMGIAGDRYEYAACANVSETHVNINYPTTPDDDKIDILKSEEWDKEKGKVKDKYSLNLRNDLSGIAGSVYGGAENGHVWADANVDIKGGYIGHAVYGGGKGKGKYTQKLLKIGATPGSPEPNDYYTSDIYSVTAGRVFGNTKITMSGGHVMRNIYGGGNMGSVGKGNYAGGPDDYSTSGYGEKLEGNLWTTTATAANPDNAWYFLNSGKTDVSITGGTVGFLLSSTTKVMQDNGNDPQTQVGTASGDYVLYAEKVCSKDDLPTGNVFGGCRGESARNVDPTLSPRYLYCPEFYAGYTNQTSVTIGDANAATGPRLYGSVYGGGQDGHVRRSTNVIINKGEIGLAYDADLTTDVTKNVTLLGTSDLDNLHWLHRGNIYGSGSGIGQYEDSNGENQYSNSSGSVTCNTTVTIGKAIDGVAGTQASPGNVIYRNVYGGGSLASVGAPQISQPDVAFNRFDPAHATDLGRQSGCQVNVSGFIGPKVGYSEKYGGEVYGGSRGMIDKDDPDKFASFATTIWTQVNIKDGATIMGNVFGGGDAGAVKKDTDVRIGDE